MLAKMKRRALFSGIGPLAGSDTYRASDAHTYGKKDGGSTRPGTIGEIKPTINAPEWRLPGSIPDQVPNFRHGPGRQWLS